MSCYFSFDIYKSLLMEIIYSILPSHRGSPTSINSMPTLKTGTRYTQPIRIDARAPAVTVVRARAMLPGGELGPIASASYLMNVQAKLPIMSLIADPIDLWSTESGIHAHPHQRGREWERPTDVTFVDRDRSTGCARPQRL